MCKPPTIIDVYIYSYVRIYNYDGDVDVKHI